MKLRIPMFPTTAVAALVLGGTAQACPICDSETGKEVREGIFGEGLGRNAAAVVLPGAAVGAVVGVIHFGGRSPRGKGRGE